jgi:folate-binding Fe-S cluster repair protein YgfZ
MSQFFDLYGSKRLTITELRVAVGEALGLTFYAHESLYRGGEYFRVVPHDGEEFVIQLNNFRLDDEMEVAEPDYSNYPVILWVAWTDRADALREDLAEIDGLDFLRRNQRQRPLS